MKIAGYKCQNPPTVDQQRLLDAYEAEVAVYIGLSDEMSYLADERTDFRRVREIQDAARDAAGIRAAALGREISRRWPAPPVADRA